MSYVTEYKLYKMRRLNRQNITKMLSLGIMLMGTVHITATFTPLIASKLAMLPDGSQYAFTYFSLMCGGLLICGGGILYTLAEKVKEYAFVRKPYILVLGVLVADGLLAVCYMHNNPFAWIVFVLTMGVMLTNSRQFDYE